MRDLFLLAFLLAILFMGMKRPFLFILTYCYVDIVAPQRITFVILPKLQLSLLCFGLAVLTWVFADRKRGMRVDQLQIVLALLLLYCGMTTIYADFPVDAQEKWGWVWKALLWSMFLPLTLTTRLRIEALALTMGAQRRDAGARRRDENRTRRQRLWLAADFHSRQQRPV